MADQLTNERFSSLFKSRFELTAHAIQLAHQWIRSGKDMTLQQLLDSLLKKQPIFEEEEDESEL
jgi:hypothetical protein